MKKLLERAVRLQQEAQADRKAADAADAAGLLQQAAAFTLDAQLQDDAAQALLHPDKLPPVIAGEVVPSAMDLPDHRGGWVARDTLATPDVPAMAASLARIELLAQHRLDVLGLGIDAADSAGCNDPLTKMLAHQAGLAHAAAFKLMDRAMEQEHPVEMTRLTNAAARMMATYQQALLTLHRLQHDGTQIISVQRINVNAGQAVVAGSMQTGGKPLLSGESK